jgi:hypothetical protein
MQGLWKLNTVSGPLRDLLGYASAAMVMEAGLCKYELSLVEHSIWIEKGDDMTARRAAKTRVRWRAGSKSLVRT